jgi:hypothetical protein
MAPASGTAKQAGTAPVTAVPRAHDLVLWLGPQVNEFPRVCEGVTCRNPGRRGDPERAPNVRDLFPACEGQREQDGSPRVRPVAEAWRPDTFEGGA